MSNSSSKEHKRWVSWKSLFDSVFLESLDLVKWNELNYECVTLRLFVRHGFNDEPIIEKE